MKHARADYDMIQDPRGKIPKDEPVFLLRGQDPKGQACMELWCQLAAKDGSDPALIELVRSQIVAFDEWQRKIKSKKSDLPPPTPADGPQKVKKGQLWESTDFRNKGQQIRVQHIQGLDALCILETQTGGRPVQGQRQERVPLSRFRPNTPMGWKLIEDVE